MERFHRVKPGECLCSIAAAYGFRDYRVIYDHPKNAPLRAKRPNPILLMPGDLVFIPDKQDKKAAGSTTHRHTYKVGEGKARLRLVLQDVDGQPLASRPYVLKIGDRLYQGSSDGKGLIQQEISVAAQQGELTVSIDAGNGSEEKMHFTLEIGNLAPVEEMRGVQARLNSLGFRCGPVNGVLTPRTRAALKAFQKKHRLKESGEADSATQSRLKELYRC
jgi:N-acetylmuramoyl-L-alanine amidase